MALDTSVAPISSMINMITTPLATALSTYAGGLITAMTAPVGVCFIIWVIIKASHMMKGMDESSLLDFGWFLLSFFIVLAMMTTYETGLMPWINDLANSGVAGETTLDQVAIYYVGIFDASDTEVANIINPLERIPMMITVGIKEFIVLVGLVPFLIAATLIYLSLKVGLMMVLALGPIFLALGLFPATRQYASAFANTVFSYVLGFALLGVIALVSINLSKEMFTNPDATLVDATMPLVIYAAIGNLLLMFLLKQVASIASSLSAGGINAGIAGGNLRSLASSIRNSARGSSRDLQAMRKGYQNVKDYASNKFKPKNTIKAG